MLSEVKQNYNQDLTDERALLEAKSDPKIFEFLVDRYQAAFWRKAKSMVGVSELADDVVQEAFVRIYLYADKFSNLGEGSFKAWGYKILVNQALTLIQKQNREKKFRTMLEPEIMELVGDPAGLSEFEQKLDANYLMSFISKLPNTLARALEWRFIKGKSNQALAEAEGISEAAAKVRVHRAKKELKNILRLI